MKKTVWTFGLIGGAVMAAFMIATLPFANAFDEHSLIVGYAGIVAGFLLAYFGVRSYRDNVLGGTIGFGRAFGAGLLIATIASLCYVATWEIMYFKFMPDFMDKYAAHEVAKARASGASDAEVAARQAEMQKFAVMYKNPVYNAALTFMEPLPMALLITLISAGVLSRRKKEDAGGDVMAGAAPA